MTSTECPKCSAAIDAANTQGNLPGPPKQGDIAVCFECQSVLVYASPVQLRLMTRTEMDALSKPTRNKLINTLTRLKLAAKRGPSNA